MNIGVKCTEILRTFAKPSKGRAAPIGVLERSVEGIFGVLKPGGFQICGKLRERKCRAVKARRSLVLKKKLKVKNLDISLASG